MPRPGSPYAHPWPKIRKAILEASGYRCALGLAGCTKRATQVDHIIPVSLGGPRLDPRNLQPVCTNCHGVKTGYNRKLAGRPGSTPKLGAGPAPKPAPPSRSW